MYDLAIIGGGPAGATLARLVGNNFKVLLLERRTFQEPLYQVPQKCCGGLIDPDAQKMLASFKLGLPKSVILSPQMFAVRTIDIDNSTERYYQRHYINTDREAFDKWLLSLVPPTVEVVKGGLYRSHEVLKDSVIIRFSKEGKNFELKAKYLIGADGAFSRVRRNSFPDHSFPRKYVAIQEWFKTRQNVNYYSAIFDSEITDFYSWIIPKENFLIVGSALLPDGNAHKRFNLLKLKIKDHGFELNHSIRKNGAYLLRPLESKQICTGRGRVGLIGEAAGFISPSSAEGISYAFKSALTLSKAIFQDIERSLELYDSNTGSLRRNVLLKTLKLPFMYNKNIRRLIIKSGVKSIDVY
jgi:geranylgeranyl diphosphate/geranylgeranyl-bacteriochlorophyllide a reductase